MRKLLMEFFVKKKSSKSKFEFFVSFTYLERTIFPATNFFCVPAENFSRNPLSRVNIQNLWF